MSSASCPHSVLVLLEALGCDQPHQERAVVGVGRRVQRRQLVAERNLVAVFDDQVGDVITLERDGKAGNGPVTEMQDENVSASL